MKRIIIEILMGPVLSRLHNVIERDCVILSHCGQRAAQQANETNEFHKAQITETFAADQYSLGTTLQRKAVSR